TVDWYQERQIRAIPAMSPHAATVPGAIDAWFRLHADHGSKDMAELLQPAIRAAENGFRVGPRVAFDWADQREKLSYDSNATKQYLPGGAFPKTGDLFRQPALGKTLRKIAREGRSAFYEGEVAAAIVAHLRALGGLHTEADFAAQRSNYVEPISTNYRG